MFSLFKKTPKPFRAEALCLYRAAMDASRAPVFYERLAVPDTMDGRFDLLLVHIFLVLNRILKNQSVPDDLAQALFDAAFEDFDQALRESGVGDMGLRKHMKRMMLAFNGRMHVYEAALTRGDDALVAALRRNLYGTVTHVDESIPALMAFYVRRNADAISGQDLTRIRQGDVAFLPVDRVLDAPQDTGQEVCYGQA